MSLLLIIQSGQAQLQEQMISLAKVIKIFGRTNVRIEIKEKWGENCPKYECLYLPYSLLFLFFIGFKKKKKSLKVSLCLLVIPTAVITLYNCHSGASECLKCSGRKGLHTGPRKSWTSPAVSMEWVISNSNT